MASLIMITAAIRSCFFSTVCVDLSRSFIFRLIDCTTRLFKGTWTHERIHAGTHARMHSCTHSNSLIHNHLRTDSSGISTSITKTKFNNNKGLNGAVTNDYRCCDISRRVYYRPYTHQSHFVQLLSALVSS